MMQPCMHLAQMHVLIGAQAVRDGEQELPVREIKCKKFAVHDIAVTFSECFVAIICHSQNAPKCHCDNAAKMSDVLQVTDQKVKLVEPAACFATMPGTANQRQPTVNFLVWLSKILRI